MEVALNDSVTFTVIPDNGYAVDTIVLDGVTYINNGTSEPPRDSSWSTIYIASVTKDTSISVSFAICTDDTGIPDKYKHTVSATAGPGGQVSPESQLVVTGEDAIIDIVPDDGMAVDTITANNVEYINDGNSNGGN